MKFLLLATCMLITSYSTFAEQIMPAFIKKDNTYIGAIATVGEISFKVLEVDKNLGWIYVETEENLFGDKNVAWLNMSHLIALREFKP